MSDRDTDWDYMQSLNAPAENETILPSDVWRLMVAASFYGPPAKLCPNCDKTPITKRGATFCSIACANAFRKRPMAPNGRFCKICQKPLYGRQKNSCSLAHTYQPPDPKPVQCKTVRPPSAVDLEVNITGVKRLRAAGMAREAIGQELGISKHIVQRIINAHGIPLAAPVSRVTDRPSLERPAKRRPITIPEREVIRWAAYFGCRRDINAVSRAMRQEDPSHPGFVLGDSPRGMSLRRS